MRRSTETLKGIYRADKGKQVRAKRFTSGTVSAINGGMAEINVGASLSDGTPQILHLPIADGFTPTTGQSVVISYPNDSPHSGIVVSPAGSASTEPSTLDGVTNGDLHDHVGGDGAQIHHGGTSGLGDDDHTLYLLASDATDRATFASNWTDLTDAGETALHTHAGGGGAPADASYLVLAVDGDLSAERVLTPGTSLAVTDDGANGHYHVDAVQDIRTTAGPSFDHVHSTVATGTAPLVVASETMVENLNADLLDGNEASAFFSKTKANNLHELLIDTFNRLLQGTLTTKSASTGTRTYTFGSAATDNNSAVQTWSGAGWANVGASTGRYSTLNAGYFETTIYAAAGNLVMTRPTVDDPPGATTAYDANATVAISGATTHSGSWNQPADLTYTVALTAGINTIRVTGNLGVQESLGILSIAFAKYVYQGVGVAGDAVRIIYAPDWIYLLSDGIGLTDNGGVDSPQLYGESPILNMPLGTSLADTAFLHDSVIAAGTTLTGVMNTALRSFLISTLLTSPRTFPLEGITVTLGTALTRGFYATVDYAIQAYGPTLAASVVHMSVSPALGVVTAVGAGSVLAVGQVVMLVATDTSTAASVNARSMIYTSALAYIAGDLFTLTS